ncbi:TPA: HAD hydrolase family protein [Bacillus cereus]|nr:MULTISPECIES: HAD hydrolase family protein [Bacillus]MCP1180651.1 HAD hydrolase family protein [Bacillus sp. 1663tsa1]MCP1284360.1 HAD hydrolase family protein [Bacillus sp. S0635]MCQ6349883.1 HAD hydrolase family protein [Bacillus cereus]MCU5463170.1 HAD hydrolase family protein [Bacillus cereus]MCU5750781.1 HAD hydrolase family protein [Bacillus cereus]
MKKIIISDLDGTLLRSDKAISESESYVYVK